MIIFSNRDFFSKDSYQVISNDELLLQNGNIWFCYVCFMIINGSFLDNCFFFFPKVFLLTLSSFTVF